MFRPTNRIAVYFQEPQSMVAQSKGARRATAVTTFAAAFAQAMKRWQGSEQSLSIKAGIGPTNIAKIKVSEPPRVTDSIRAICRVLRIDPDALVFNHQVVEIEPMPATEIPGSEFDDVAAYLAIRDTPEGQAIRTLIISASAHAGKP